VGEDRKPPGDQTVEFTLKINMDNAAFEDRPAGELAKCLNKVVDQLPTWASGFTRMHGEPFYEGKIKDSNGNTVGSWQID
jgi:hypothetical protein